jgi:transglutaminase TgpA-like protein/transglutaminase superfamily protein
VRAAPRTGVALVAGVAVLLASGMLSTLFAMFDWAIYSFLSVAAVVLVACVARALRVPVWGQLLAMLAGLLLLLTWTFPSGHELARVLPSPRTFRHFGHLLTAAGHDIQTLSVPVGERVSLEFLVAAGIGLVAVMVDVLAIGLRRPALAGLPLLALYSVPVAVQPGHVSWLPFVAGAAGYLWLLMADHIDHVRRWGRRFTGTGRDVDMWEPSPLAATGRRVGFASLVLAVLVPLAIPNFSTGLLDAIANLGTGVGTGSGTTQLGARINPITTLRGNLRLGSPINLFQLTTDDPNPGYLRTAVLDRVTDNGFETTKPANDRPLGGGPDESPALLNSSLGRHQYQARVNATNLNDYYLPLFANVVSLNAPSSADWRYDSITGMVYASAPATAGQTWSFTYDDFDYRPSALRAAPALDDSDRATYSDDIQVPRQSTIADKVAGLTAGKPTEYDKVRAILDFFSPSNGFAYSLRTKQGTSGSAIVDFLHNKRGYCEQYASAMAWMVRQAGIPARVVVGYTHGTQVGNGDVYQVTSHEAHAWVEVYFPSYGWVPFDPTPATDVSGSTAFGWAPNPSTPTTGGNIDPNQPNKPGQGSSSSTLPGQHGDSGLSDATNARPTGPTYWPFWVLGFLALLAVLGVPAMRRATARRRRTAVQRRAARGGDAGRAAHAAWDELLDTLVDTRLDSPAPETPRAAADRLTGTQLAPDAADALRLLATAEERARYARSPHAAADLPAASHRVRTALLATLPRHRRLAAVLAPRSVLRRWRTTLADLIAALSHLPALRTRVVRAVLRLARV